MLLLLFVWVESSPASLRCTSLVSQTCNRTSRLTCFLLLFVTVAGMLLGWWAAIHRGSMLVFELLHFVNCYTSLLACTLTAHDSMTPSYMKSTLSCSLTFPNGCNSLLIMPTVQDGSLRCIITHLKHFFFSSKCFLFICACSHTRPVHNSLKMWIKIHITK